MFTKGKILSVVSLVVMSVATQLITTWHTDRTIEQKVNDALAEKNKDEES